MKQLKKVLALAVMAAALGFSNANVSAQGFDPEQMRQRMMERYREQLEIKSDDEWKAISPMIEKVTNARRDVMAFGGGGFGGFGGRGGPGGRGGGNDNNQGGGERRRGGGFFGEPPAEATALRTAIENKASADDVKAKLAKYRDARKAKEAELTKAQEDLKKVLSVRQEAAAVVAGLLQ